MLRAPLLTVHEVSDLVQMTEATVRAWIRDNQLRAIKFGRDWRIARVDLEDFLNAHANIAPSPSSGEGKKDR
ncbi:MAG: excisionase [Rhodospirillaceae bacterium]|nr:excisionase [Rhodospirillaceae bacterium]